MKISMLAVAVATAAAAACAVATAAENPFLVNFDVIGTADADIKGSNAEMKTTSYGLNAGNKWFTIGVNRTDYDFSNTNGVEPFDSLNKIYADLRYDGYLTSSIRYYAGINLAALYESDIDLGDSYNIAPRIAVGWEFMDGITAFAGAYASLNEADNIFEPILGLEVGREGDIGWSGAIAYPTTRIQYRFNPTWAVDANFMTVRDTYYLDDDSSKPAKLKNGYMREESYGAGIGVTFTPVKMIKLSAGLFSYWDREFKFYDNGGNELGTVETDNSNGAYLRGSLVF